jgi:protocatechuate 3,4-dioxygenase beta subunit
MWLRCAAGICRAIGLTIAIAEAVHAQPPRERAAASQESGTAAIRGRVVTAASGDPIRNARVSLTADHELPPLLTDADGRFAFAALPAGDFTVDASKPGYAKGVFGARTAGGAGTAIHLAAGASIEDVVIALARGAAISGSVIDDAGEPVGGASVMIERASIPIGTLPSPTVALTDEKGDYRAGSLPEGRVRVSVFAAARDLVMLPNGGGVMTNGGSLGDRIYYPGALKANDGEPIMLQRGEEKRGIDFVVPARAPRVPRVGAPPRDRGAIGGRVVAANGRTLSGAQVALLPTGATEATARFAITDAAGAYLFVMPQDVAGTFRISARREGYLPAAYGQRAPGDPGDEVEVGLGEVRSSIDIALERPAAVSGTLYDENGDPVEGATIRAIAVRAADGRLRMGAARMGSRPTDDLGRYRLPGLAPGDYVLAAVVGQITGIEVSADLPGYATTFFPGTAVPSEGQPVSVRAAQDVSGVDFSLVRTRTARVSGRAADAAGQPISGGIALMPSRRSTGILPTTIGARIERDGRFEFTNVAPGEYVLQAQRHRNAAWNEGESSVQYVTVNDADVTGLEIRTSFGSHVSGRFVVEGAGAIRPSQLELSPIAVDPDLAPTFGGPPARALIGDDLSFELAGLRGPRRLQVLRTPPGFALKSIRAHGIDLTDAVLPFGRPDQSLDDVEVTLTSEVTEITGIVADAHGRGVDGAAVVVFPIDDSLRYARSRFVAAAAADREGRYRIEALPPGEYYAAPVLRDRVDVRSDSQDPDFLDSLSAGAVRVTLGEAGHVVLPLKLDGR